MRGGGWAVITAVALVGRGVEVHASCAGPRGVPHQVDPGAAAGDQTPPSLPALSVERIERGRPSDDGACGASFGCEGAGAIVIVGIASDDQTPQERIGYRFSWAEGRLPEGMRLPGEALDMRSADGRIWLEWEDGASEDQEALAFSLDVVAVDAAGNESAPQRVRVVDPGSGGGCRIAGGRQSSIPGAALLVGLAVIGGWFGRRRRRRE